MNNFNIGENVINKDGDKLAVSDVFKNLGGYPERKESGVKYVSR